MGFEQTLEAKRLRRLYRPKVSPVRRLDDPAILIDQLDRIGDRNAGHCCLELPRRLYGPANQIGADKGPGGIMDKHNFRPNRRKRPQPAQDRILTCVSPEDMGQ